MSHSVSRRGSGFIKTLSPASQRELKLLVKHAASLVAPVVKSLTMSTRTAQALAALQRKAPNASLVAVYKKYCSSKYNEVRTEPVGTFDK